jgi:hypothetical protein
MAKAATATKPTIQQTTINDGPAVHHMARGLASTSESGAFTADQLDAHCATWLEQGYRLLSVHPTYVKPEQGPGGAMVTEAQWHILYIFVRD